MLFKSKIAKIITVISIIAALLLLASCTGNGGALTRTSFTVDRSSIKTAYLIGEEIDFSGIKATAKYSDANLTKVYTFEELRKTNYIPFTFAEFHGREVEETVCEFTHQGETITEDEIKTYVKEHMAKHKTPKYVKFVSEFPMNAAGKILKYKMREMSVEELNLKKAASIETA